MIPKRWEDDWDTLKYGIKETEIIKEMLYIACSHNRLSNIAANFDEKIDVLGPGTHLKTILT